MSEKLYQLTDSIANIEIQDFVKEALDHAPPEFWTSPFSTIKYHPPEIQGKGGIIRHAIKCVHVAKEMCRFYNVSPRDRDIIIASLILHDIKKNGFPWGETTDMAHGKLAADWINRFSLKQQDKEEIQNCIRYHAGRWTRPTEYLPHAMNPSTNELIVQLVDYFCSRRCASFLPGMLLKNFDDYLGRERQKKLMNF